MNREEGRHGCSQEQSEKVEVKVEIEEGKEDRGAEEEKRREAIRPEAPTSGQEKEEGCSEEEIRTEEKENRTEKEESTVPAAIASAATVDAHAARNAAIATG